MDEWIKVKNTEEIICWLTDCVRTDGNMKLPDNRDTVVTHNSNMIIFYIEKLMTTD